MTSPYTIRRAHTKDLDRLVELLLALQDHIEASNPDLWKMTDGARANLKSQLAARIAAPDSCALVAVHDRDGVVGTIFGRVMANKRYTPSLAGSVDQAFVLQDHRRAGVGSQLVAELCRFFAAQGVEDLTLRYVAGNEIAASFWQAVGFSPRITTAGASRQKVEAYLSQTQER
jgi:GNAT superfamily N-acetyltransferase